MRYALLFAVLILAVPYVAAGPCAGQGFIAATPLGGLDISLSVSLENGCEPGNAQRYSWTIDWGDGSSPTSTTTALPTLFDVQHAYPAEGDYDVTADVAYEEELSGGNYGDIGDDTFTDTVTVEDAPVGPPPPPPPPDDSDPSEEDEDDTDACPTSQCSAVTSQCECGSVPAQPGEYCYGAGDVRSSAGSCSERLTNALGANGAIHLCGPLWSIPDPVVTREDLCTQIQTFQGTGLGRNFTCSANATGWFWFPTSLGVPSIEKSNAQQYALVEPYLTSTQRSFDAIACADGAATQAVTKYSPPPRLKEGSCSVLRCYDGTACVRPETRADNHICRVVDGEAWWISGSVRAANAALGYAPSSGFILNCGPKQFGVNKQEGPDQELSFCQLARLSGVDADRIVLSVALPVGEEGTNFSQIVDSLRQELARMHDESDLECLDEDPEDCDFLEYDPEQNAVVFTNENSLTPGALTRLWDWFTGVFTGSDTPELKTRSASKILINTDLGVERSVEYVADTECSSDQEIIGAGECFTQDGWRQVIQTR